MSAGREQREVWCTDGGLHCYAEPSAQTILFVSRCPALKIVSQGRTMDEARAALDDSVRLYIEHCQRRGIGTPVYMAPERN